MSHEITIRRSGFAEAAFARKAAWHNLGQVLPQEMTSSEAIEAAGLDWKVVQQPMGRFIGQDIKDPQPGDWMPCINDQEEPSVLANVREDTGLYLGNVTDQYKVVQNTEAFAFMDSLVTNSELKYEAAFSLSGGRKVVMLARMPGEFLPAEDDRVLPYILMSMHHDGTGAIRFGPTAVRTVCANTYQMALSSDKGKIKELVIRHSGRIEERLADARAILLKAKDGFEAHANVCNTLANHRMTQEEWETFINVMCPYVDRMDPDWTQRRENAIHKTRQSIIRELKHEDNDTAPLSAWAAFNAVTAHVDHLPRRGANDLRRAEARFNVTQYGAARDQKRRAFITACRIANVSEEQMTLAC